MDFSELKAAVLSDTRAEQHEGLIARKINAAIRFTSLSGLYYQDTVEAFLQAADGIDPSAYVQAVSLPSRFRSVAYLKNSSCKDAKFRSYAIEELAAKPAASNVYYSSGVMLHIKHAVLTEEFYWGYYTYPVDLSADADTNWLTEMVPELIIDYAAAMVLNQLGEKETSGMITNFSRQNLQIFMRDNISAGTKVV